MQAGVQGFGFLSDIGHQVPRSTVDGHTTIRVHLVVAVLTISRNPVTGLVTNPLLSSSRPSHFIEGFLSHSQFGLTRLHELGQAIDLVLSRFQIRGLVGQSTTHVAAVLVEALVPFLRIAVEDIAVDAFQAFDLVSQCLGLGEGTQHDTLRLGEAVGHVAGQAISHLHIQGFWRFHSQRDHTLGCLTGSLLDFRGDVLKYGVGQLDLRGQILLLRFHQLGDRGLCLLHLIQLLGQCFFTLGSRHVLQTQCSTNGSQRFGGLSQQSLQLRLLLLRSGFHALLDTLDHGFSLGFVFQGRTDLTQLGQVVLTDLSVLVLQAVFYQGLSCFLRCIGTRLQQRGHVAGLTGLLDFWFLLLAGTTQQICWSLGYSSCSTACCKAHQSTFGNVHGRCFTVLDLAFLIRLEGFGHRFGCTRTQHRASCLRRLGQYTSCLLRQNFGSQVTYCIGGFARSLGHRGGQGLEYLGIGNVLSSCQATSTQQHLAELTACWASTVIVLLVVVHALTEFIQSITSVGYSHRQLACHTSCQLRGVFQGIGGRGYWVLDSVFSDLVRNLWQGPACAFGRCTILTLLDLVPGLSQTIYGRTSLFLECFTQRFTLGRIDRTLPVEEIHDPASAFTQVISTLQSFLVGGEQVLLLVQQRDISFAGLTLLEAGICLFHLIAGA